jgi:hypothetical protein
MLRGVKEKDKSAEIYAIHDWVQRHLTYRHDPAGVELVIETPQMREMLSKGISGFDCDDMVAFEGAALRSAGIPVDIVVIKADSRNPQSFSHIYLTAYDVPRGKPVPLDPIMKDKPPGWEPPMYFHKKYIKVDGLANQFGLGAFEHEKTLALRYVPKQAMSTGTAIAQWNNYINRKKHFYSYMKKIADAFDRDVANIYKDASKNEAQKDYLLRDLARRRDLKTKQLKEKNDPKPPGGIPNSIKIQFLRNQNRKLADYLYDLKEIKRIAMIFRQIGNQYLERVREEEVKIQRRAHRHKKHLMKLKIMRMGGEIALQFIPYVGTLASTIGTIGNKLYEIQENAREVKWLVSAMKAAEAALGPGTSEIYLLDIADDIDWKVEKAEASIALKMDFNDWLISQLKKQPVIEETPSGPTAVAAPRVSGKKALAIGGAAAGFIALVSII